MDEDIISRFLASKYRWWLFLAICFAWAFWGSVRVGELAVDNIQPIGQLDADLRQSISEASWPIATVFFFVFIPVWFAWTGLPMWIFIFVGFVTNRRHGEPLAQRILLASKEVIGLLVRMPFVLLIWFCCILIGGFLGNLIGLYVTLLPLGWFVVAVVRKVRRSTKR